MRFRSAAKTPVAVLASLLTAAGSINRIDAKPTRAATEVVVAASAGTPERPVLDLTRADFEVLSDGAPVTVSAAAAGPGSVAVILLVDISLSIFPVDGVTWASGGMRVRESIPPHVLPTLRPGDQIQIGVIGREITITPPLTPNRGVWERTFERLVNAPPEMRAGPSPIWDATAAGITALAGATSHRRSVMVLTDGRATGNRLGVVDVLARAIAANIVIDVVDEGRLLPPEVDPKRPPVRPDTLVQQLAEESGGQYLVDGPASIRKQPEPGPLVAALLTSLRCRYVLAIDAPVADGRLHRLDVRVKRPGVSVRAPRAYFGK